MINVLIAVVGVFLFLAYDRFTWNLAFKRGFERGIKRAAPMHKEVNASDMTYCTVCNSSWDINDPHPPHCYIEQPGDPKI